MSCGDGDAIAREAIVGIASRRRLRNCLVFEINFISGDRFRATSSTILKVLRFYTSVPQTRQIRCTVVTWPFNAFDVSRLRSGRNDRGADEKDGKQQREQLSTPRTHVYPLKDRLGRRFQLEIATRSRPLIFIESSPSH